MKISREQLKALVKECLVELLSEGLGNASIVTPLTSGRSIAGVTESRRPQRRQQNFDPRLDTPVKNNHIENSALKEAIKRNAGGNPIMESIFADTAATTLQAQLSHGDSGPAGSTGEQKIVQQEQFNGSPEQVFGEDTTSRWANLAFMDSPPKKTA